MKARKASKSKAWCLTCREKPQTLDSDSSDEENNVKNKVDDKTEDKTENQQEQKNIPSVLSKRLPETDF